MTWSNVDTTWIEEVISRILVDALKEASADAVDVSYEFKDGKDGAMLIVVDAEVLEVYKLSIERLV